MPNTPATLTRAWKAGVLCKMGFLAVALSFLSTGCVIHFAGHCNTDKDALKDKLALLPVNPTDSSRPFIQEEIRGVSENFTVFIPRSCYLPGAPQETLRIDSSRAPVVICEELFTLSPALLKLAQRLADQGFAVYVPILFGNAREDPNSAWLAATRGLSFGFGKPDWKANDAAADDRPVIHEIAGLCTTIAARHPKRKMGVIGLCITGSFPLELLAERSPIAAPVISQPAIPLIATNFDRRASFGMSQSKMLVLQKQVNEHHLQVLGFRFELDQISPPERFANIQHWLKSAFFDATLPASDYIYQGGCPSNAHAVLTDGYSDPVKGKPETRGHFAYRQLVWFLKTRLNGEQIPPPVYTRG